MTDKYSKFGPAPRFRWSDPNVDTPDSDIDIMILVDLSEEEMDAYSDALSELGFKYNVQHDIWMMPVVKNQQHF